jgi:hypothetical protein
MREQVIQRLRKGEQVEMYDEVFETQEVRYSPQELRAFLQELRGKFEDVVRGYVSRGLAPPPVSEVRQTLCRRSQQTAFMFQGNQYKANCELVCSYGFTQSSWAILDQILQNRQDFDDGLITKSELDDRFRALMGVKDPGAAKPTQKTKKGKK